MRQVLHRLASWVVVILLATLPLQARAATGTVKLINFQGKVASSTGTNVTNGSYTFIFSIYTASSGGSAVWTETKSITVTDGLFQTNLGSSTTLPGSLDFNTDNLYLGITFNGDGEMTPRIQFTAVPQALNAQKVAGLTVTDTTGTLTVLNGKTISFGDSFTTSGSNALTLATTGTTSATLPSGTVTLGDTTSSQTLTNKTIGSTGLVFSGATTDIDTAASEGLTLQGRAASAFNTTAGDITFQPAGSGTSANVQIGAGGAGSATPDLLVIDTKSDTSADPTGTNGGIYYNSVSAKFRCYQGSAWSDCMSSVSGGTVTATTFNGLTITNNGTNTLNIAGGKSLIVGNSLTLTGTDSTSFAFPSTSDTVVGLAATQTLTNKTIGSTGLVFSGAATDIDTAASEGLTLQGRAASTFNTTAGNITFQPAGSGTSANVQIGAGGAGSTTPDLLVLDSGTSATDPTGITSGMYYNTSLASFRCYQNSRWQNCDGSSTTTQPYFPNTQFGYLTPLGVAATTFTSVGLVAVTATGTASASAQSDDYYINHLNAGTAGAISGLTQAFTQTQGRYKPKLSALIRTDTAITNTRIWVSLNSAALTGSDGTGATTTRFVGVRYSTNASDTTWQCGSGDGTTGSVTNTGVTVATSTAYLITVDWTSNGTLVCSISTNGGTPVRTSKTTNLDTTLTAGLGITVASTQIAAGTAINHKTSFIHLESR